MQKLRNKSEIRGRSRTHLHGESFKAIMLLRLLVGVAGNISCQHGIRV